jgi:hypothetical protein
MPSHKRTFFAPEDPRLFEVPKEIRELSVAAESRRWGASALWGGFELGELDSVAGITFDPIADGVDLYWHTGYGVLDDPDGVYSWEDEAGGLFLTVAGGGNKPDLIQARTNGIDAIQFDGTDDYIGEILHGPYAQPVTTYLLWEPENKTNVRVWEKDIAADMHFVIAGGGNAGKIYLRAGGTLLSPTVITFDQVQLYTVVWNGASSEGFINNVSHVTGDPGSNPIGMARFAWTAFAFQGFIYEHWFYNGVAHDSTKRTQIYDEYFKPKYGLP